MGSNTVFANAPVIDYGDVLILSVKPQIVPKILPALKMHDNKKLLISIAMGISLTSLEKVKYLYCNKFIIIIVNNGNWVKSKKKGTGERAPIRFFNNIFMFSIAAFTISLYYWPLPL